MSRADRYGGRRRLGVERPQLGVVRADYAVGGLGHLVPDPGNVAEGFGDDQSRVLGDLLEELSPGVELAQRGNVGGVEQRERVSLAGVPKRPDALAVASRDGALERVRDPVARGDRFDESDRLLDGGRRVVLEAESEGEIEEHLSVRLALDLRIHRWVDGEDEVTFDRGELVDVAVVHEQPAVVAEGVAAGLLHGAADRRPDMREEQRGTDVAGKLTKVAVVPGRFGAVEDAGSVGGAVPTDPEPVAVGRLGPEPRAQALGDER